MTEPLITENQLAQLLANGASRATARKSIRAPS